MEEKTVAEEQTQESSGSSNLIKIITSLVIIGIAAYGIIKINGGFSGVSGENIKYKSKTENAVYVYSVCPECDHVGDLYEVKISSGENDKAMEVCDSCEHMFEMYVERK